MLPTRFHFQCLRPLLLPDLSLGASTRGTASLCAGLRRASTYLGKQTAAYASQMTGIPDPVGHVEMLTTIHPTSASSHARGRPTTIALHGLDLFSGPVHISIHRFYRRPQTDLDVVRRLKSSLARALGLYPPVAGTVRADGTGKPYIDMRVENRLGTPFLTATKDTPFAGDTDDLSPRPAVFLPPPASALAVKVTQVRASASRLLPPLNIGMACMTSWIVFLRHGRCSRLHAPPSD